MNHISHGICLKCGYERATFTIDNNNNVIIDCYLCGKIIQLSLYGKPIK